MTRLYNRKPRKLGNKYKYVMFVIERRDSLKVDTDTLKRLCCFYNVQTVFGLKNDAFIPVVFAILYNSFNIVS